MAKTIPLIRAAVLFPLMRWMKAQGQSEQDCLARVGLEPLSEEVRERPIPLLKVFELFHRFAAQEGPDACARLISPRSLEDLGVFGAQILDARTPREALKRAQHVLPRYSTHEIITLRPIPGSLRLHASWSLPLDQEVAHLTQQFTAALVYSLCRATDGPSPALRCMRIRPHPVWGIDHLRTLFADVACASEEAILTLEIDDHVLDAPFAVEMSAGLDMPPADWVMPHGEGSFSASFRLALEALHAEPVPRLDQVAEVAALSPRSLQRMLTNEGTSFRSLLDESRRTRTLGALQAGEEAVRSGARDFGFSGQSALARAVRRWTGLTPKGLQRRDTSLSGTNPDVSA